MPATPTTVFATKAESDSSRPRVLFPRPAAYANMAAFTHLVSSSRWRSATAPRPGSPPQRRQSLRLSAPASNKPHPAEKSTPVWLAIWRIWAGFANSQLRLATLRCIYIYICAHPHCFHLGAAAQTDANLSAHLHRLPTPPPYLRRMRLLPSRVLRSCKSPSTLGAATRTSGKG